MFPFSGVGFNSISFNGKLHLNLILDQGIFKTKERGEQLMNFIISDIEELKSGD